MPTKLNRQEKQLINDLVELYQAKQHLFSYAAKYVHACVAEDPKLMPILHSSKYRIKDPGHLREKLKKKALVEKAKGKPIPFTKKNLFKKITDLAGVRLLHLQPRQFEEIKAHIDRIVKEGSIVIKEGPIANVWDNEFKEYFEQLNCKTRSRHGNMYMSVHYVVRLNSTSQEYVEIQIRTLMEEVWGEVDHSINYPDKVNSIACAEQLRVLARLSSAGTRLVDSIYLSYKEFDELSKEHDKS